MRFLSLGGVAGPVLFASTVVVCGTLRPGYSHVTQFISELGEHDGSHAALMNGLGFVGSGVLLTAFGVSLANLRPRGPASVAAVVLMVVYGLGITAAGRFSCDPGCPSQPLSSDAMLHRVVSLTAFGAGITGIAVWAYRFRSLPGWQGWWRYSAISSAAALVFLLVVGATEVSRTLAGVWQRLAVLSLDLWCAVVGVRLFRARRDPIPASTPAPERHA